MPALLQAIHVRMQNHVGLMVPEARCSTVALCRVLFGLAGKHLLVASPSWQVGAIIDEAGGHSY